jgi:hypothetical protein
MTTYNKNEVNKLHYKITNILSEGIFKALKECSDKIIGDSSFKVKSQKFKDGKLKLNLNVDLQNAVTLSCIDLKSVEANTIYLILELLDDILKKELYLRLKQKSDIKRIINKHFKSCIGLISEMNSNTILTDYKGKSIDFYMLTKHIKEVVRKCFMKIPASDIITLLNINIIEETDAGTGTTTGTTTSTTTGNETVNMINSTCLLKKVINTDKRVVTPDTIASFIENCSEQNIEKVEGFGYQFNNQVSNWLLFIIIIIFILYSYEIIKF